MIFTKFEEIFNKENLPDLATMENFAFASEIEGKFLTWLEFQAAVEKFFVGRANKELIESLSSSDNLITLLEAGMLQIKSKTNAIEKQSNKSLTRMNSATILNPNMKKPKFIPGRKCLFCGEANHWAANCPHKRN